MVAQTAKSSVWIVVRETEKWEQQRFANGDCDGQCGWGGFFW